MGVRGGTGGSVKLSRRMLKLRGPRVCAHAARNGFQQRQMMTPPGETSGAEGRSRVPEKMQGSGAKGVMRRAVLVQDQDEGRMLVAVQRGLTV